MRLDPMPTGTRTRGSLASWCVPVLLAACVAAPANEAITVPTPEQIPALQRQLTRDSSDLTTRLRLAEAQRRAGKLDLAEKLLDPVVATTPVAAFYMGLVREDQGRAADARLMYQRYLERGRTTALRDQVRDRLELLDRTELQQAVRAALAGESRLPAQAPDARTVGVFPFLTTTTDPQVHSLGTGLAELLTVDLAQTNRLRVLERARIQQLLNEIQLSETRRVDPASAVRSGRLLRAGTLIQGRVDVTSDVSLQAFVVLVARPTTPGNPLREREAMARLFDIEKKIALGIYERMGIQLSPAERDRVSQQATRNVQALLEFGFGLESQDAGRYAEASTHFQRAADLDPNFTLAKQRAVTAQAQARAVQISVTTLAQLALSEVTPSVRTARGDPFGPVQRLVPDPGIRDATTEALGTEGIARHGTVQLIIPRPGGA